MSATPEQKRASNGNGCVNHMSEELADLSLGANSLNGAGSETNGDREAGAVVVSDGTTVHPACDAPLCHKCQEVGSPFFNSNCLSCRQLISDPSTSVGQLFAIMRQWVPQIQQSIELLVREVLQRGVHIDDRDELTDMTLLHFACKSGAKGVGDVEVALRTVKNLVEMFGASVSLRCRWTDMNAIHYAVYFDVGPVLQYLLDVTKNKFIDEPSRDFDGGTPLHIAAANMCLESAKILLKNGANILLKDDLDRTPLFSVPEPTAPSDLMPIEATLEICSKMKKLLEEATLACIPGEGLETINKTGKVVLLALGLGIGDRVVISNQKLGTLRYCGATHFASGIWAGVELLEPEGKNDGTVGGVTYFRCSPKHGIFAPINKIAKFDENIVKYCKVMGSPMVLRNVNHPRVDVSHVTPKVETGLSSLKSKSVNSMDISIGKRIILNDRRIGTVRFVGETQFASGLFIGLELDKKIGKNDGSVNGIRYFDCRPNYGIFTTPSRVLRVLKDRKLTEDSDNSSDISLTISQSSTDNDVFKSPHNSRKTRLKTALSKSWASNQNGNSSPNGDTWLTVGVNVFINNTIGVIRYIGPVEFAGPGVWLGVELRTPTGKNDGSVNGVRYFQCKPNHGLLVRPKKVSVRGINGAKLLPQ